MWPLSSYGERRLVIGSPFHVDIFVGHVDDLSMFFVFLGHVHGAFLGEVDLPALLDDDFGKNWKRWRLLALVGGGAHQ